jgi:hypothetical protein
MRTTLILEAEPEVADFLSNQPNTTDPSTLVNKLLQAAKEREGLGKAAHEKETSQPDEFRRTLEDFLDENTHAGG